ncbi:MAG: hypothetical protein F7B18_00675 [Desulfurococcales archaeon]|nr:hypothetical protein [Desulfurococcales archaeon]
MRGRLGFWETFSIGIGSMIGGGIFAVLGLSLQLSDNAAPIAFMVAGLVALLTSYSYAKLASRYPSEGVPLSTWSRRLGRAFLVGGLTCSSYYPI